MSAQTVAGGVRAAVGPVGHKEARALFLSPIAVIFLGVFLFVTEFSFFTLSGFFARNLADLRPLFQWMPILLILLVSAITMRQWAEERKMGTLEVLLTLPVRTRDLVLGKFLAGMLLVSLALLLTLPIPIAVSFMGQLDWGPVVGGYLGALLLAAAYMSMGLCVSASTDNQVVALMVTLVAGAALYLVGSDALVALFSDDWAAVLRGLGTGSRFASIERGVLDLRDLVYYGSLTAIFLVLNVAMVEAIRQDTQSDKGFVRAFSRRFTVFLVLGNAIALNIWLAPFHHARADLTTEGLYSISPVTEKVLGELDEPLVIQGVFSEKTHPKLAPIAAQIKDYLLEYQVRSGSGVAVEFLDPSKDEQLEEELGEQYGIRSFPFRVSGRHEQSVVNSYFHVLIKYGDKHEELSWEDLVEIGMTDDEIDVRLRNLEYDVTRAIRRVSQEFQTIESLFDRYQGEARLTAYLSPETIPSDLAELPDLISKVGNDLAEKSGEKLAYAEVDPLKDPQLQQKLYDEYGIAPLAVDLFGRESFYLAIVLEMGDKVQAVQPRGEMSENDLETALTSAIKRALPGNLKTLGIFTDDPDPVPQDPRMPPQFQPPQPQADYQLIQQLLTSELEIESLGLEDGAVPDNVDVLLVAKPGEMSDEQRFALDQYLMRGGAVVALAGRYAVEANQLGLSAKELDGGLAELLEHWGVKVGQGMVMDPYNAAFPLPVQERAGGFVINRVEYLDYPFFPDIRQDGFAKGHAVVAGLPNVTVPWVSPVEAAEGKEGLESEVLMRTSEESWVHIGSDILPDFEAHPQTGFGREGDIGARPVAVTLKGSFDSWFAERPSPVWDPEQSEGEGEADRTGRTLKKSMPDARLAVIGSSELTSDIMLSLAQQMGGEVHRSNLMLLLNLVDWCTEDTDLLKIRSAGTFARTLKPLDEAQKLIYEVVVALLMLLGLLAIALLPRWSRRLRQPLFEEAA